ncbi:DMT family transporter [Brachybacterium paraconglomeratum]|uniref:DMT family transporter n=1 Tax=Brachybacterium paraconglomeratum TaxID=173362 RepID=UPI003FD65F76
MDTREPTDSDHARSRLLASSAVLSGALCLSVSAILVKLAGVDAATTAMLRCAIAVLVLVPLMLGERARRGRLSGRGVGWAIAAGVALGVDYAAWTAAIYQVGAGISTVLINVQVIVLPLLAFLFDRERVTVRFLWALPLMLLGISLVGGLWDMAAPGGQAVTGTLLGLVAGVGYGIYLFLTRRATKREPGRMIQTLAWATASATVTTTVIALFSGGLQLTGISARSWVLLVVLAVLGQVIAWLLIHHGSIRLEPVTTAALLLIQPVLALGLSALTLAEYPTLFQLLGAVIVVIAVALSNGLLGRRGSVKDPRLSTGPAR